MSVILPVILIDALLTRLSSYMNAEKYNLDRIYFGGCFIRGGAIHGHDDPKTGY